jgi:CTP synthase
LPYYDEKLYGRAEFQERHRHRYEINAKYLPDLEKAGLVLTGLNPKTSLPEILEAKPELNHPFYIGVQYHPEFSSRPNRPNPLFLGLVKKSATVKS